MAATNQDFEFYVGEDIAINVQVEATLSDEPQELAGASIHWMMIRQRNCEVVLEKNVGDGIVMTDPDHGIFTIVLTHEETGKLATGLYDHNAVLTGIMGNVAVITVGEVVVKSV